MTIQDISTAGKAIAASGLFGIKTTEQAVALMLIAQAEGYHPAIAARDYHVIQGRPTLKADAMLARFQSCGGAVRWLDYTDQKCTAEFSHPQGGKIEISWDMARAKSAELGGKDNWKKYPRQMLRARVISEGIRTVFPGCVCGVYTPEEVSDFEPEKKEPKNIEAEVLPNANEKDSAEIAADYKKLLNLCTKIEDLEHVGAEIKSVADRMLKSDVDMLKSEYKSVKNLIESEKNSCDNNSN
jgi:hypothetical protein